MIPAVEAFSGPHRTGRQGGGRYLDHAAHRHGGIEVEAAIRQFLAGLVEQHSAGWSNATNDPAARKRAVAMGADR